MKGDVICHAVEVKDYYRTLPNGKRVLVRSYRRQGNAAQDDLNRRVSAARQSRSLQVWSAQNRYNAAKENFRYNNGREPGSNDLRREYNELNAARQAQNKAGREAARYVPTTADAIRYAATDAYEATKVAVGNVIEDAKFNAQSLAITVSEKAAEIGKDISKTASNVADTVKKAVSDGANAVSSFFKRLFGRR